MSSQYGQNGGLFYAFWKSFIKIIYVLGFTHLFYKVEYLFMSNRLLSVLAWLTSQVSSQYGQGGRLFFALGKMFYLLKYNTLSS